ncbi:hypothetical protein C0993_009210 [Termitomyces sp. T159_Od127]|nr:hypothetical protein C0993_009210 [Termitomyces sp. T159_Od127]
MSMDSRRRIPENPTRWKPNPDPASINVPGLDTSAPVLDQIEQIEQLITLQNIDENFAKIHHVLANKVLPALKRYAVTTEPVREAAKFWTSFYEQAAQIKIPTFDDHSTVNEESQHLEMTSTMQDHYSNTLPSQSRSTEPSMTSTNVSFMPGQDAFSSTPATTRMTRIYKTPLDETADESTWKAPFFPSMIETSQLSDSQQALTVEDATISEHSRTEQGPSTRINELTLIPTPGDVSFQSHNKKGKSRETSLLRNVLRHNLYPIDTSSESTSSSVTSPLKYRGKPKTPVPKKYNPFLSPEKDPSQWNGIVDLADPSTATPRRFRKDKPASLNHTPAQETDDDSFDGLPPGMSPPVLMSPARPPRSMAELDFLRLGQTPGRDASTRIARDLVRDVQYRSGNAVGNSYLHSRIESTMSTVPTPPSLSRYRQYDTSDSIVIDSSLESMMRRVGLNVPSSIGTTGSTPGLRIRSHAPLKGSDSILNDLGTSPPTVHEEGGTPVRQHEDLGMESDSDSMDEINNTAYPSHAFLMASAGVRDDSDDSFDSNRSSDSLDDQGTDSNLAPIHPFAGNVGDDGFDDSYDDEMFDRLNGEVQEETLFGVLPQQRMQALQRSNAGQGLRMLGEDLLQDTIGIQRIEESPTPAPRQ